MLARPASWGYRLAKFARRNRFAVAAAGIGVAALLAGLAVAVWQASVAKREQGVAERRLREVRAMARTLIFDVHDAAAGLPGSARVRELLVVRALEYLDRLAAEAGRDTTLMRELADAYERLGRAQRDLIASAPGAMDAVASEQKSLRLREGLLAERPGDTALLRAAAETRKRLGTLTVFETDFENGLPDGFSARGTRIDPVQGFVGLGGPANAFAGSFLRYETDSLLDVTLTLRRLPPHDAVSLSFLLAIIDSWDGTELLEVKLDDRPLFSHWFRLSLDDTTSYRAPPGALLRSGSDRGFTGGLYFNHDRAYDLSADPSFSGIPHTADSLRVVWRVSAVSGGASRQWQGGDDESWALDNVRVEVSGVPAPREPGPADAQLRLLAVTAKPAPTPGVRVEYEARDRAPVTIELYDAAGRRAASAEPGVPAPGRNVGDLRTDRALAPGPWLVRIADRAGRRDAVVVVVSGPGEGRP